MVDKKKNSEDLTRIEDLSEFLHQDDSEIDSQFDSFDLELPPEIPSEEIAIEETPSEEFSNDFLNEAEEITSLESEEDLKIEPEIHQEIINMAEASPLPPEKFEDVKNYAKNFSYGHVQGGGNPPFSIIVRNIKYKEDANDIINILNELSIITPENEKETLRAMEIGALIIPQISEFTAIILAHKFRRFDLDLEIGLSDEIHPSKSGEANPKGLLKKENLKQNKKERFELKKTNLDIKEIIVTTSPAIPGHTILKYIGVETTFTIIEEEELEKLQYVQKQKRMNKDFYDIEKSTDQIFKDYESSFFLLYEDLTAQLKQKAFKGNANAILSLNFQLSPLHFERAHQHTNAYQITASCTLAFVKKEDA